MISSTCKVEELKIVRGSGLIWLGDKDGINAMIYPDGVPIVFETDESLNSFLQNNNIELKEQSEPTLVPQIEANTHVDVLA